MTPESILNALTLGRMQIQAIGLTDAEQRAVAVFLAGRPLRAAGSARSSSNKCTSSPAMSAPANAGEWNGWGGNVVEHALPAKTAGLTAADLPRLKLKWAFGYPDVTAARAQPTVAGGRLFVASENGEVHALDPKTGCTYWTFKAQAGVRTALSVGAVRARQRAAATPCSSATARQRVRRRRATRARAVDPQGRRPSRPPPSPARRRCTTAACSCRCRG